MLLNITPQGVNSSILKMQGKIQSNSFISDCYKETPSKNATFGN